VAFERDPTQHPVFSEKVIFQRAKLLHFFQVDMIGKICQVVRAEEEEMV